MTPAPLPHDEDRRLAALARYEVLDTLPEEAFDRLARLAARSLGMPVAIVNFVAEDRQWGKATHNTGSSEAPREHSFCAWTILDEGVTVVDNAHQDPRFRDNPQVTGAPHIHTYAGAPLVTPDGHRIGSLCVVSPVPREITPEDREVLAEFAALVVDELELRYARRALSHEVEVRERAMRALDDQQAHAETLAVLLASLEVDLLPVEAARLTAGAVAQRVNLSWVGLAEVSGGRLCARTVWRAPDLGEALPHLARQGVDAPGTAAAAALTRGAPLLLSAASGWSGEDPLFRGVEVGGVAALPLGPAGGGTFVYLAARLGAESWSAADGQLLEAAAGSVRVALERQERARGARTG